MNKPLTALMTRLKWQLSDLQQQIKQIEHQIMELDAQFNETQQRIANASTPPQTIIPEREIAGLHFIMGQQQIQDDLKANKKELHDQQKRLNSKKLRLETELKMLERYQKNQQEQQRKNDVLNEQNNIDEWIMQRRTSA